MDGEMEGLWSWQRLDNGMALSKMIHLTLQQAEADGVGAQTEFHR
jgi:hypothetical protein